MLLLILSDLWLAFATKACLLSALCVFFFHIVISQLSLWEDDIRFWTVFPVWLHSFSYYLQLWLLIWIEDKHLDF